MQVMYTKSIHHFFLLSQILLDVYLMYTKNVHHGNVIHTVYTICLQKVYYQCSNFGKGNDFGGSIFREWYFMFFVFFSDEGIKYSPKNYSS